MTFGQRVAQKRKELGLSQEGLGERLGVSRQAIYKWESDAALPEIDKLITLSKLFSVPVGWLLGVEENEPETVNQDQEKLIEAVLSRYQAAQPKPQKSAWDKWSVPILFAMCGIILVLLVRVNNKVNNVEQGSGYLFDSIATVRHSVDAQIRSITSQVEEILNSQNSILSEFSTHIDSIDPTDNTVTFARRVVPKTYTRGMTALFAARSGEDATEQPVELGEDHSFSGQITCPLSDQISLRVIFVTDDWRQTQWLGDYDDLYTNSFPHLNLHQRYQLDLDPKNGVLPASGQNAALEVWNYDETTGSHTLGWAPSLPAKLQVGLFREKKLVLWYEGRTHTIYIDGIPTEEFAWFRPSDVVLDSGTDYHEAAVYTDEYGRQRVYCGTGISYHEESIYTSTPYADGLEGWEF